MLDIVESLHSVRAELELSHVRGQKVNIRVHLMGPDGQKVLLSNTDVHQLDSALVEMERDHAH